MTDSDLITRAIEASGQPARVFAVYVLGRDKRTVERWRAGQPIPPIARDWLRCWLGLKARQRDYMARLLIPESERQPD